MTHRTAGAADEKAKAVAAIVAGRSLEGAVMRIGIDEDTVRRTELDAWAAQIAAMHASVARLSATPQATAGGSGSAVQDVAAVSAAEGVRAQMLRAREGQMTLQDGMAYLQVAADDLTRSREVLRRMHVVAAQAVTSTSEDGSALAYQRFMDRSLQELEGIAEQARSHTLRMLGGTASAWSLPERADEAARRAPGAQTLAGVVPPQFADRAPRVRDDRQAPSAYDDPATRAERGPRAPGQSPLDERVPIGTPTEAAVTLQRISAADQILATLSTAVEAAHTVLTRTIRQAGYAQAPDDTRPGVLKPWELEAVTQQGATTLVEATRAQFDAVTTVLGGALGAAAVSAASATPMTAPREVPPAPRPVVEAVTAGGRSARTSPRGAESESGAYGGGVRHR